MANFYNSVPSRLSLTQDAEFRDIWEVLFLRHRRGLRDRDMVVPPEFTDLIATRSEDDPTNPLTNDTSDLLERELKEGLVLKDVFWLMEDLQYPRDYIVKYAPVIFERFKFGPSGKLPYNSFIHACNQDICHSGLADPFVILKKLYLAYKTKLEIT